MESGHRYFGKVLMEKGKLKVETNKRAVSLRKDEVIDLVPGAEKGKKNFWREIEGNLDVGYSLTRGNMIWNNAKLPQAIRPSSQVTHAPFGKRFRGLRKEENPRIRLGRGRYDSVTASMLVVDSTSPAYD